MYRYNLKREADRTVKTLEYERGISNTGNWYRMKRLFERAKAGEELTIGFLGGSITQGVWQQSRNCVMRTAYMNGG